MMYCRWYLKFPTTKNCPFNVVNILFITMPIHRLACKPNHKFNLTIHPVFNLDGKCINDFMLKFKNETNSLWVNNVNSTPMNIYNSFTNLINNIIFSIAN